MIIVGLGNPEEKYRDTRHNTGVLVLNKLHKDIWLTADDYEFSTFRKDHLLVKPSVGMNNSGVVVWYLQNMFKTSLSDIIVVHDEMDFEPGKMKIKLGGGDGKHNGVKSVISNSGAKFIRVRVGIGKPNSSKDGIDHVLGKFSKHEKALIDSAVIRSVEAINHILTSGVQSAMAIFNRREISSE